MTSGTSWACASFRPERRSPPLGSGTILPVRRYSSIQRAALSMLTSNHCAYAFRDTPHSIAPITRMWVSSTVKISGQILSGACRLPSRHPARETAHLPEGNPATIHSEGKCARCSQGGYCGLGRGERVRRGMRAQANFPLPAVLSRNSVNQVRVRFGAAFLLMIGAVRPSLTQPQHSEMGAGVQRTSIPKVFLC